MFQGVGFLTFLFHGKWASAATSSSSLGADQFVELSQILTGHKDLSPEIGAVYLRRFVAETANQAALKELYDKLKNAPESEHGELPALLEKRGLSRHGGLAHRLISGWYLGVDTGSDPLFLTYTEALMYRPTHNLIPIPTLCDGFGSWVSIPEGESQESR